MLNKNLTTQFNLLLTNCMLRKTKLSLQKKSNSIVYTIIPQILKYKIKSFYQKNLRFYPIHYNHIFICYFFSIKKHRIKKYKIYNINYNITSKLNLRMCFKTRKKFKFKKKEKKKKQKKKKTLKKPVSKLKK